MQKILLTADNSTNYRKFYGNSASWRKFCKLKKSFLTEENFSTGKEQQQQQQKKNTFLRLIMLNFAAFIPSMFVWSLDPFLCL